MSVYRLEIFDQALQPVDVAPIPQDTEIVDDFVTIENYEIMVPKLVDVERGHVLRIMDGNKEIAVALVSEAEQTKTETRITASPIISILDFDTLEPLLKSHPEFSQTWYNIASNQLVTGSPALDHHQTAYISMPDTGAWLVSALAVKCREFVGSGSNDPVYCINDLDITTANVATRSTDTIDGEDSLINSFFSPNLNGGTKYTTQNVFDVFVTSRTIEGRTFRAFFDFSGTRPRLRIYMRKAPANVTTIDADLPNIIEKEINIAIDSEAANRCTIFLVQQNGIYVYKRDYYRHADGTVDMDPTDPITPVIPVSIWVDYDSTLTMAENEAACDDIAANALTVNEENNKIALTVRRDDQILEFDTMRALSSATILHHGNTYKAAYTGCRIKGDLVTYYFGTARTDLTSKIAIAMRDSQKESGVARPFDPWDVAVPQGSALTSNNGIQTITGGSVSAGTAYGSYIIANVSGQGYTTVSRTNGQGRMMTISKDGVLTETQTSSLTIDSSIKWVIAHRTASSQAVLRLNFS